MIYVLNYYSQILTYPNGDLIKFKEFQVSPIVV